MSDIPRQCTHPHDGPCRFYSFFTAGQRGRNGHSARCWNAQQHGGSPSETTGERLHLTVRELELLTALVERRNRIVTREELYREVWGEPYRKSDRSVDVYVGKLRQKLENAVPGRRFIHTHFGFGYRFAADADRG
jgi:DNA-binding response OmpR family regulator